jgi:hypothetical protein
MASPYPDSTEEWDAVTERLIAEHPLHIVVIREVAFVAWETLWATRIGRGRVAMPLGEIRPPATVVGYFFEKLFARELESRYPNEWRGARSKDDKDVVYVPDSIFSIEMKTSGQLNTRIFGNRSYNQKAVTESLVSKQEKSGYYITVNFYEQAITLLRFGWIDVTDWKSQKSATGQAASLSPDVYKHKLVAIPGKYRLHSPIRLLEGVGAKAEEALRHNRIATFQDMLNYSGGDKALNRYRERLEALASQFEDSP